MRGSLRTERYRRYQLEIYETTKSHISITMIYPLSMNKYISNAYGHTHNDEYTSNKPIKIIRLQNTTV